MWVWTDELTDRIGDTEGREIPLVAIYIETGGAAEPAAVDEEEGMVVERAS